MRTRQSLAALSRMWMDLKKAEAPSGQTILSCDKCEFISAWSLYVNLKWMQMFIIMRQRVWSQPALSLRVRFSF